MAHKTSINIFLAVGTVAALTYGFIVSREYFAQLPEPVDAPPPAKLEFVRALDPQYEIFDKEDCQLEGIDEWTANAIKIRHQGRVYQFKLYFVQTPESVLRDSTRAILSAQAEYFGDPPLSKLLEHGEAADQFIRQTLTERPFRIITRFEPERGTKSLYAFIQVDTDENIRKYLSAILVRKGLASITAKSSHTPFGQNALDFREHLVSERENAINERAGIWADSRLAQKLDEIRESSDSQRNEDHEETLTPPE